jgi:hypothetical protein
VNTIYLYGRSWGWYYLFSGRPRIDGKEFFRQARFVSILVIFCSNYLQVHFSLSFCTTTPRTRLSYEQFGAFLANIKEFNAQKQSREVAYSAIISWFGNSPMSRKYVNTMIFIW